MRFDVPAEHYDRLMGRYAPTLASALIDVAGVSAGDRVVDVGCGPGGLTHELVDLVGAANVAAIEPEQQFATACRERHPGVDVRVGVAERLPWDDGGFDAALSSLVVAFMSDPDQGLREMARVTRTGGTVAACMWDVTEGGMTMLRIFWDAVHESEPDQEGQRPMVGTADGDIGERMARAGLADVTTGAITARAAYADFDDFWEPLTLGVGSAGTFLQTLSPDVRARVRESCRAAVPEEAPFTLDGRAWYARGTVPG